MSAAIRSWGTFFGVAAVAAIVDLVTKWLVFRSLGMPGQGRAIVLIPAVLAFETNLNEGALFGMGQGMSGVFAAISIVALIGILGMMSRAATRADRWLVAGLGLIVGGIVGNLYDRLGLPGLVWHAPLERQGEPVRAVRDWIHVVVPGVIDWPIFNLADSWLVIGAATLLWLAARAPAATHPDPEAAS